MDIRLLTTGPELAAYDRWVQQHADGTLWQSLAWKRFQEARKRTVHVYAAMEGATIEGSALVVVDRTVGGYCTWDVPRGPLLEKDPRSKYQGPNKLVEKIVEDAKNDKCFSLFLSPLQPLQPTTYNLQTSSRHEQPDATRVVDISQSDDDILKQMHQKGRYNIKVAEKNGVRVEPSTDASLFATLMKETAQRDGFKAASEAHYRAFLENIEGSFLLLGFHTGDDAQELQTTNYKLQTRPIAGLIGVIRGTRGIYYYGASDHEHRAMMAPYALQWAAIQHCKAAGCTAYDLLGVAPRDAPANHPWQGISGFKEKFGGAVITYPPEQEYKIRPFIRSVLGLKRKLLG